MASASTFPPIELLTSDLRWGPALLHRTEPVAYINKLWWENGIEPNRQNPRKRIIHSPRAKKGRNPDYKEDALEKAVRLRMEKRQQSKEQGKSREEKDPKRGKGKEKEPSEVEMKEDESKELDEIKGFIVKIFEGFRVEFHLPL
ncbi:hypothetical protein Micbo1qcDRAFT_209034 [Microdochium bolleyi]|uniref:Uncharacterized protein n=1 Tax=Microdochium bolleyi TaxID=196109 RepID=A0A136INW2_9PEZI|nr:hypothetical protein Micbo1qcDRAFT_209034 [Microdochium bolleyi]